MPRPGVLNTKERYGSIAQMLHWATAILILTLMPLGIYMHDLPISSSVEISQKVWLYSLHKTLGMAALTIAVIRVFWAFFSEKPAALHPERKLETFAAGFIHWILYISIILVPVVGFVHHASSVGFAPIWGPFPDGMPFIPKSVLLSQYTGLMHFVLAFSMGASVLLHIAGALKHAVLERDETLSRMIPFKSTTSATLRVLEPSHSNTAIAAVMVFPLLFLVGASVQFSNLGKLSGNSVSVANAPKVAVQGSLSDGSRWIVDHSQSSLGIEISQLGSPVKGEFGNWDASIVFDAENLSDARVNVSIDTNSLSLGGVTTQAKSADFLDVEKYPEAVFASEEFMETESGYVAKGTLQLHGKKVPLDLPFTLDIQGNLASMSAFIAINRMDYAVGAAGFADEASVTFDVKIMVELKASRSE
ncbi:MAG: YceI family protein [Pseudomonadota bacterium]